MDNETLAELLATCRASGLRKTHALVKLLKTLGDGGVWNIPDLRQEAMPENDLATTYRLLARLEHAGIVRRVALPFRAAYFTMAQEQGDNSYFVVHGDEGKFRCVSVGVGEENLNSIAQLCNAASAEVGEKIVRCEITFYTESAVRRNISTAPEKDDDRTVYTAA